MYTSDTSRPTQWMKVLVLHRTSRMQAPTNSAAVSHWMLKANARLQIVAMASPRPFLCDHGRYSTVISDSSRCWTALRSTHKLRERYAMRSGSSNVRRPGPQECRIPAAKSHLEAPGHEVANVVRPMTVESAGVVGFGTHLHSRAKRGRESRVSGSSTRCFPRRPSDVQPTSSLNHLFPDGQRKPRSHCTPAD